MPMLLRLLTMMRSVSILTVLLGLAAAVVEAAPPKDLVQASLVADVNSVKPGQAFKVGILLKIKPHWHVYWKYPGDSGQATSVEWKLPEGFKASDLEFPLPIRFEGEGDLIGYGYTDEVMLTATITPPSELSVGKPIELSANVDWLVCEKVCIPGKETVKIDLPVSESASPANAELFARWKSQLPSSPGDAKAIVKDVHLFGPQSVAIEWTRVPTDIQWFPAPPEGSGVENLQTTTEGQVSRLSFGLAPAPKQAAPMLFLVTFKDHDGNRRGVEFTVNIPPAAK